MTNQNRFLRRCAASVAVLAALTGPTGCGSNTKPAAAPSSSAPAALPTQDWNRLACATLPTGMLETLENLGDTRKAAEAAMKSTDRLMQKHGDTLERAVTARETADLQGDHNAAVDANLDISRAAIDMVEACSQLYGDGNW
ncbi:hypothetical protein ABZY58_11190 [Micromonospora tulbaghiae]|uniref:hypothetical protein n=1 Tax=Micromonospora tulbaghiae TaxID=479978 RepID=UPI0033BD295B